MMRAYVFRLYPTKAQIFALNGQLAGACDLYNAALQERRDAYRRAGVSLNYYHQAAFLKDMRAEGLIDVANFSACQAVLMRLQRAMQAFFRRVKAGEKPGYPRFRAKARYDSLTFPSYRDGIALTTSNKIRIQGVGKVRIKQHREILGEIKTVTVKRRAAKWYAVLTCDIPAAAVLPATGLAVGVDVGITDFATLSDDSPPLANGRFAKRGQAGLRIAQRRVARRKKGSNARKKAVRILQVAHARIGNQRADMHHKAANGLVAKYDVICVEDLNIKGLAGGMLAKHVLDCGWGSFLSKLAYKAESAGRTLVKVNPRGTSQRCSRCGRQVFKKLSERWHDCSCGLSVGRDVNAARNILGLGRSLAALTWGNSPSVAAEATAL
jgi:putative transposase